MKYKKRVMADNEREREKRARGVIISIATKTG